MLGLFGPNSDKIAVYKAAFAYQGPFRKDFSTGSPVINEVVLEGVFSEVVASIRSSLLLLLEGRCYLVPTLVLLLHTTGPVQGQGTMRSLVMVLLRTTTFFRSTRPERPESVARMPIRSVFGG